MRLHEEYLQRHGLKIPVINHCATASLFLKNDPYSWSGIDRYVPYTFLKIFWIENNRGLGNYAISHLWPIRDGKDRIFEKVGTENFYWDQYEDYLYQWCFDHKEHIVSPEKSLLAGWEMFVYILDSWFKKQPQFLKTILFESLDEDNSISSRLQSYKEIYDYMNIHSPGALRIWKEEILIWVGRYSKNLATLFEGK